MMIDSENFQFQTGELCMIFQGRSGVFEGIRCELGLQYERFVLDRKVEGIVIG